MYAVFTDGARQYRVTTGDVVKVDYREAEPGQAVEFGNVLLYSDGDDLRIGRPTLDGLKVVAEVVDHPSTKLRIQHFRRRKNYKRLRGHRQWYTRVRVQSIG
jgi:large subunit ribosomal protein L21